MRYSNNLMLGGSMNKEMVKNYSPFGWLYVYSILSIIGI